MSTIHYSCFFPALPIPPSLPLFPYTTLFRSLRRRRGAVLPDRQLPGGEPVDVRRGPAGGHGRLTADLDPGRRSEEHTSELQSRGHLVCRLLLEKKKHITSSKDIEQNHEQVMN